MEKMRQPFICLKVIIRFVYDSRVRMIVEMMGGTKSGVKKNPADWRSAGLWIRRAKIMAETLFIPQGGINTAGA
jgi:hypothetical protein